jgi:A/G-specific adenine glycosylase
VTTKAFQKTIFDYYRKNRRTFPWRSPSLQFRRGSKNLDPYKILVSEIMLQQTQTLRAIPKYENWISHFPTFESLAQAPLQQVLKEWKGLGYNSRALRLHQAAKIVVDKYNGKLPADYETILALPGIGPYTAGAVMAFAFNKPFPIIETNIRTVFIHFYFKNRGPTSVTIHDKEILELVKKTLPEKNSRDWYYALMDYGVMLKKTVGNLNIKSRHYTKQSQFKGSNRELRAKILHLITQAPVSLTAIQANIIADPEKIETTLSKLQQEGFIKKLKTVYYIH